MHLNVFGTGFRALTALPRHLTESKGRNKLGVGQREIVYEKRKRRGDGNGEMKEMERKGSCKDEQQSCIAM